MKRERFFWQGKQSCCVEKRHFPKLGEPRARGTLRVGRPCHSLLALKASRSQVGLAAGSHDGKLLLLFQESCWVSSSGSLDASPIPAHLTHPKLALILSIPLFPLVARGSTPWQGLAVVGRGGRQCLTAAGCHAEGFRKQPGFSPAGLIPGRSG